MKCIIAGVVGCGTDDVTITAVTDMNGLKELKITYVIDVAIGSLGFTEPQTAWTNITTTLYKKVVIDREFSSLLGNMTGGVVSTDFIEFGINPYAPTITPSVASSGNGFNSLAVPGVSLLSVNDAWWVALIIGGTIALLIAAFVAFYRYRTTRPTEKLAALAKVNAAFREHDEVAPNVGDPVEMDDTMAPDNPESNPEPIFREVTRNDGDGSRRLYFL